jgi:hypothetical protein
MKRLPLSRGWKGIHAVVRSMENKDLPLVGRPSPTESNPTGWMVEYAG